MSSLRYLFLVTLLLFAGCASEPKKSTVRLPIKQALPSGNSHYLFAQHIRPASKRYGIDEHLIRSIIEVESGFDPAAVSKSNAIGLMQIKSDTSGRDVFRMKGRSGEPSRRELMDPAKNIDIGTAYLSILKNRHLVGIQNPKTMRYAMIVAYANGAGALLRTFDKDRKVAVRKINRMSPEQFYKHVHKKHPAAQAPRYLHKVNRVYLASR